MEKLEINLMFSKEIFREIYFNENVHYLELERELKEGCKKQFVEILILIALIFFNSGSGFLWGFIIMFTFINIYNLYVVYEKRKEINHYIKSVEDYLEGVDKFKKHQLILEEKIVSLKQDEMIESHRWGSLSSSFVDKMRIRLTFSSKNEFLIPLKSIEKEYHKQVLDFVRDRVSKE